MPYFLCEKIERTCCCLHTLTSILFEIFGDAAPPLLKVICDAVAVCVVDAVCDLAAVDGSDAVDVVVLVVVDAARVAVVAGPRAGVAVVRVAAVDVEKTGLFAREVVVVVVVT